MKNKLILIIIIFCLTGCSINYDLTIDDKNNYAEKILINALEDENNSKSAIYAEYLNEYPIFIDEEFRYYDPTSKSDNYTYYNKSFEDIGNGYNFSYQATYNKNNFKRARSINTIFKNVEFAYITNEDYYYLSLKDCIIFNYDNNIKDITANINFKNIEVLENNADSINNNTYTWNITKDSEVKIKYKINKNNTNLSQNDNNINNNKTNNNELDSKKALFITIGVLLSFVLGLFIIINFKKRIK